MRNYSSSVYTLFVLAIFFSADGSNSPPPPSACGSSSNSPPISPPHVCDSPSYTTRAPRPSVERHPLLDGLISGAIEVNNLTTDQLLDLSNVNTRVYGPDYYPGMTPQLSNAMTQRLIPFMFEMLIQAGDIKRDEVGGSVDVDDVVIGDLPEETRAEVGESVDRDDVLIGDLPEEARAEVRGSVEGDVVVIGDLLEEARAEGGGSVDRDDVVTGNLLVGDLTQVVSEAVMEKVTTEASNAPSGMFVNVAAVNQLRSEAVVDAGVPDSIGDDEANMVMVPRDLIMLNLLSSFWMFQYIVTRTPE